MDDRSYNNKAPLALQVSSGVSPWPVSSLPLWGAPGCELPLKAPGLCVMEVLARLIL